jgi:hypothetical protein
MIVREFKDIENAILTSNGFTKTRISNIYNAILSLYDNENTRSKYISVCKKLMLQIEKKPSVKAFISEKMNYTNSTEIRKKYDAKTTEKMENLGLAFELSAKDARNFVKKALNIIEKPFTNDMFFEVFAAITCLTGRRPSEILRGSWSFEVREFYTYAVVCGASKKRNDNETIEFPLLYTKSTQTNGLKNAIDYLQKHQKSTEIVTKAIEKFAKIEKDAYLLERKVRDCLNKDMAVYSVKAFKAFFKITEKSTTVKELEILLNNTKDEKTELELQFEIAKQKRKNDGLTPKNLRQMYVHLFIFENSKGRNVQFEGKIIAPLNFISKVLSHGNETKTAQSYYNDMQIV